MKNKVLLVLLLISLSSCCVKVAEVERTDYPDGSFSEEVTGFRYDCTAVIMIPGGRNLVSHKAAFTNNKEDKVTTETEDSSAFK